MTADPKTPVSPAAGRSRWRRRFVTLLLTLAVGALIWSQLPSGSFPTDLTRVGTGRPAVVLTQDASYISGMEVMELMNEVREQHGAQVEFLVAHLGVPDGQRFAAQHGAADGTVLLFAGDGRRVGVLHQPRTVEELRAAIAQAFGLQR